jgi:histone acetyltransferase (RNA polymerase elongator complex component)
MSLKHIVIPIFIPHKGCPFDCIYCNQKKISGQIDEVTEKGMREIIDSHLESIQNGAYIEIGFYGGSFTGIERERQIHYLEIANEYIKRNLVKKIRLSTRPDYISKEILDYLKYYNVGTIELGVQSLDEEVLSKTYRGHNVDDVIKSSNLIKDYGFSLGIQTMIGLPGDNFSKAIETAKKVIGLKPEIVRIYPTLVIKETYLLVLYRNGKYIPLSLDEAVSLSAQLLEVYELNNINVIRIGLQPTENINAGMDIVAGPFHPAFRQLVESKLVLNKIEKYISNNSLSNAGNILVYTSSKNVSNVVGQHRENLNFLKSKYNFRIVKVITDDSLGKEIRVKALGNI